MPISATLRRDSLDRGDALADTDAHPFVTSAVSWGPMAYFVDSLFRRNGSAEGASPTGSPAPAEASERARANEASEVGRIFRNVSRSEPLPAEDALFVH